MADHLDGAQHICPLFPDMLQFSVFRAPATACPNYASSEIFIYAGGRRVSGSFINIFSTLVTALIFWVRRCGKKKMPPNAQWSGRNPRQQNNGLKSMK